MSDLLRIAHDQKAIEIASVRDRVVSRRKKMGYVSAVHYFLSALSKSLGIEGAKVEFLDRTAFGADVALTVPTLLRAGSKEYVSKTVPELVSKMKESALAREGQIVSVESKGIYVNVRFADRYFYETIVGLIETLGTTYGESDIKKNENVAVDYSSPNVAKHLHAGHIRSTIIGHVLSNLYEAVGYTAHRINHINDWGGFGFLMEAYARWGEKELEYENKNDFLYSLYTQYRALEKEADLREGAPFEEFKSAADARFRRLEAGEKTEVELWQKMVSWSLADFQKFYDLINIHPDYTVGESFYAESGKDLVTTALKNGTATNEDGAAIVHLDGETEFPIRRGDESTIYATRDLAALAYRASEFMAKRMVYVVGQEQTDYFAKLFRAADILGILPTGTVLEHVPFGFYVAASNKKKLSSREGAQNVIALVTNTITYFAEKYPHLGESDIKAIAVGSICFNDIKKNRMMAVELDTGNVRKMIRGFEESGAAYVMYAIARARSIVRKSGGVVPTASDAVLKVEETFLLPVETGLMKRLADLPAVIARAAETNEPSVLAEALVRIAQDYNSYYEQCPVMVGEVVQFPHRLALTQALATVLTNGLRLCHVDVPERM